MNCGFEPGDTHLTSPLGEKVGLEFGGQQSVSQKLQDLVNEGFDEDDDLPELGLDRGMSSSWINQVNGALPSAQSQFY